MSWCLKIVGTPAAVRNAVLKEATMPQGIVDTVVQLCDEPQKADEYNNGVLLEGCGHSGGGFGNITLKFERVRLVSEAPVLPQPTDTEIQTLLSDK